MGGTALLLVALLAGLHMSNGLTCLRCDKSTCSKVSCSFGEEPGICNCCPRCLKGPNQVCGGIWNIGGSCARGLTCTYPPNVHYGESGTCVFKLTKKPYKVYGD